MSNSLKRAIKKSKFLPDDLEDFLDSAKLAKETCKTKKPQKRQQVLEPVDEDLSETAEPCQPSSKKNKVPLEVETGKIVQEKVLKAMESHLNARQEGYDTMLKKLSDVIGQMKADNSALKSNQQKLLHLTSSVMKCMEQVTTAQEQKLQELTEIFTSFKKQVEGLIIRGGMKPDERPLWFDVYKAFPPFSPPLYARPKPEVTPLRPILYKEDALRAKFHSKGHGIGVVNMLAPGEGPTKRLLKTYEKLDDNLTEDEKITKCLELTAAERLERRQEMADKVSQTQTVDPRSVTGQILNEAQIQNIFKDDDDRK